MNKPKDIVPLTEDLDRIIHEPARLHIILYLYVVDEADFTFLLHQTGLTRGNLSVHLQKLEASGYVESRKEFRARMPRTLIKLTPAGRIAFEEYKERILGILQGPALQS